MEEDTTYMGTRDAAAYLDMPLPTLKYHVEKGHLHPIKIGRTRLFTKAQLDTFQAERRKPGRPRKKQPPE